MLHGPHLAPTWVKVGLVACTTMSCCALLRLPHLSFLFVCLFVSAGLTNRIFAVAAYKPAGLTTTTNI